MKLMSRNALTNIVGAALTAWMGDQAIAGRLTLEKVMYAAPVAIVNFATGSKDSKLAELERRLNLSPSDRAAAKKIGGIVLNQIANRFGYRRINDDLASFDSRDRSNVLGAGTVGGVRDQYTDRGDRLDAGLLDGMAASSGYGDRGSLPDGVPSIAPPENIRAQAWAAADVARGNVPIEGTNLTRRQFADFSNGAVDSPDGPRTENW